MASVNSVSSHPQADNYKSEKAGKNESDVTSFMEAIAQKKAEIFKKVKNGETEESFQIGGAEYTLKEWEKMLKTVDAAIDSETEETKAEELKAENTDRN